MAGHLRLLQELHGTKLPRDLKMRLLLMVPDEDNVTKTHPTLKRVRPMKAPLADGTFTLLYRLSYPSFGPKDYMTGLLEGVMEEAKAHGVSLRFTEWEDFGWNAVDIYPDGEVETVGSPQPSSVLPNMQADTDAIRDGSAHIRKTCVNSTTETERAFELFRLRSERRRLYESLDRQESVESREAYENRLTLLDTEIDALVKAEEEAKERPDLVAASFFCPSCGCRLYREPQAGSEPGPYSIECVNANCTYSFPHAFTVHHPVHGLDNGPGDSWSLSFVK